MFNFFVPLNPVKKTQNQFKQQAAIRTNKYHLPKNVFFLIFQTMLPDVPHVT